MQDINTYLRSVEKFLNDLSILDRSKIISQLNEKVQKDNSLTKTPPLEAANKERVAFGFKPFEVKSSSNSFGRFLLKVMAFMFVCFLIFIGFLVWKFSPLFEIDEHGQKVKILGGLIDIDGKAGKFVIVDDVYFSKSQHKNDFTGSINTSPEIEKIFINFNSGKLTLKNSESDQIKFDCKLSEPPNDKIIKQASTEIQINLNQLNSSSCTLNLPEKSVVEINGETGAVVIAKPHFDLKLELDKGSVSIDEDNERAYYFDLQVQKGVRTGSRSGVSKDRAEHKIEVNIQAGTIH